MSKNRREFLKSSVVTGASLPILTALASGDLSSIVKADPMFPPPQGGFDKATFDFWTQKVREPSETFAKGLAPKAATDVPEFVYYDSAKGFMPAGSIDENSLPDKGGVKASFRVQGFRPSNTSTASFNKLQSGSLRVDVKQTAPLPDLVEVLAWSAVAAFLPATNNQLPALKDLTFNPGESWGHLQEVPLTNGLGFWSWNFFLKKKESVWGKLMRAFKVANKVVFPLLGFPAIAVTALAAVDRVVGYLQAQEDSNWLFRSVENPIYATKEAKGKIGSGIALRTGNYVVIPRDQLAKFGAVQSTLEMKQGYLVKKGTSDFNVYDDALKQIPDVDYISLAIKVDKAP